MATQTANPTSEVSVTGTWSGTNRYLLLDDYPDSGNPITDGTTCSGAGVIQFGFSALSVPAGATGISVQVNYYDFKNASQASAIGASLRCNDTTNRNAATHNPGNGNANIASRSDNYATNPKSGVAWTVDDVNGVGTNGLTAFGLNCSDASPSVTVSCIQLQVTYTPGTITQALSATATATASLVQQLSALQSLSASVTSTAAITKQVATSLSAAVTATAAIIKQTAKSLSASVAATAAIVTSKVFLVAMSAAATVSALMSEAIAFGHSMSASATVSAAMNAVKTAASAIIQHLWRGIWNSQVMSVGAGCRGRKDE